MKKISWNKISRNYPYSFLMLKDFCIISEKHKLNFYKKDFIDWLTNKFQTRILFDFFDKQGIIINILYDRMQIKPFIFIFDLIYLNFEYILDDMPEFDNRIYAENMAFEKAFKLLENKIKELNIKA